MATITSAQVVAFRHMADVALAEGDKAIVALAEEHAEILEADELEDIAALAADAYDRIQLANETSENAARNAEQPKTTAPAPRVFTEEQTRANAVRVISNYPAFTDVVDAMETDLTQANEEALTWVGITISDAMKAVRDSDQKWVFHSWVRDAMRIVRDRAFARANEMNVPRVMVFLAPLLWAWEIVMAGEKLSKETFASVELALKRARPSDQWAPWAKKCLEHLISEERSEIAEVLASDLAGEIAEAHADFKGAAVMIDGLQKQIRAGLETCRQNAAKKKAADEVARRARQLERAGKSQAMKGRR